MTHIRKLFITMMSVAFVFTSSAQEKSVQKATAFGVISNVRIVPSIAEQIANGTFIPADNPVEAIIVNPRKNWAHKTIPGKGFPRGEDPIVKKQVDAIHYPGRNPSLVFDTDPVSNFIPTDPTGAIGPNHYLAAWNNGLFRIFDREGVPLIPQTAMATVLTGNGSGDPIVLYDRWADRFIMTMPDFGNGGFEIAVTQGPDPINDGWYVYTNQFTQSGFPDYPKFSIWSDGYYITANMFNVNNRAFVLERDKILTGDPAQFVEFPLPGISFDGFHSPQVLNVTGGALPPPGNATFIYFADDAWAGVGNDHLKIWTANVDWVTPSNSTMSSAQIVVTEDFTSVFDGGAFGNLTQPSGPDVDALQGAIYNSAQFRVFPGYNSALFNFLVDVAPGSAETAAIRWYELRQTTGGAPWTIYQEGTYVSPNNGKHAFMASMAMDQSGHIGMGYTTVSQTEQIAIYYTGRFANDPLGVMTVNETLIKQGTGNNLTTRYGDYSHLTLDPVDGKTFWHISEYFNPNRNDVVGVFKIAPDLAVDVGVIDITAPISSTLGGSETVTVLVRNFGLNEQSNIPVSYSIDGGTPITEILAGPIPPISNMEFTFSVTADLSVLGQIYAIDAYTGLIGDEDPVNDPYSENITHLNGTDMGVSNITAPGSGDNLTASETVTVTIKNYGGETQVDIPVSYSFNGGVPVEEIFPGPVEVGGSGSYSFTTTANVSGLGIFPISAATAITGDSDLLNDAFETNLYHINCIPTAIGTTPSNGCTSDGFKNFELGTIMNPSSCESDYGVLGYGDFTYLSTDLDLANQNPDVVVQSGYAPETVVIWIDFNDNNLFELSERVLDPIDITTAFQNTTFQLSLPDNSTLGEHILRARASDEPNNDEDPVTNPCGDLTWGETEDYTVNIIGSIGLEEVFGESSALVIAETAQNQFNISMETDFDGIMTLSVVNASGQTIVSNRIANQGGKYFYDLDMTYVAAGVYLVRMGDYRMGRVKRIVVK